MRCRCDWQESLSTALSHHEMDECKTDQSGAYFVCMHQAFGRHTRVRVSNYGSEGWREGAKARRVDVSSGHCCDVPETTCKETTQAERAGTTTPRQI